MFRRSARMHLQADVWEPRVMMKRRHGCRCASAHSALRRPFSLSHSTCQCSTCTDYQPWQRLIPLASSIDRFAIAQSSRRIPRSADTPTRVTGRTRRLELEGVAASGMWLILDAIPQGEALATFAAECAAKGVIGLLAPQLPNAEGYLVKRIVGQRPVALPVLSVRADLLPTLEGQRVVASAPIRPTHPLGGHVLGVLPGSDPTLATAPLIVSAHYDGVGDDGPAGEGGDRLPCATDNAAGVAVILELARLLASSPQRPQRSIIFAALDAEEVNAVGSRFYATALRAQGVTPLVVNLDGAAHLHEVIQIEPGPGAAALLVALDLAGEYLEMPLAVGQISSDNRRFAAAGFPSVGVGIGLSGLHTPADMVDRVEPEAMRRAGKLLLATGWQIAYRG